MYLISRDNHSIFFYLQNVIFQTLKTISRPRQNSCLFQTLNAKISFFFQNSTLWQCWIKMIHLLPCIEYSRWSINMCTHARMHAHTNIMPRYLFLGIDQKWGMVFNPYIKIEGGKPRNFAELNRGPRWVLTKPSSVYTRIHIK